MFKKLATNIKKAFDAPSAQASRMDQIDSIYWDNDLYEHLQILCQQPNKKKSRVEQDILNGYMNNKVFIDNYHNKLNGK